MKDSFDRILGISKRKQNSIESDRDRGFYNNISQGFFKDNIIELYSRSNSYGAVFAEKLDRTIRNLPKRSVFEKGDGNWVEVLPRITKQYNNRMHTSTKFTPIQASLIKNERFAFKNLLDKGEKVKPMFQVNDLVGTSDLRRTFSKSDTTTWSYKLYKNTEIINDSIPSYRNENLPER